MKLVCSKLMRLLMLTLVTSSLACGDDNENMTGKTVSRAMNKQVAQEIRQLINEELHSGASAEEIEMFFERHSIVYSFDRFNQSYNGIIRNVSAVLDQAVVIHIYVDEERRFKSAEVQDSFTAP